jgi:leader peptidase (prepilin peptidase)/N-methyltransferase
MYCGEAIGLIISIFSFAMGACIASFLNVVIWRVPRGESIAHPPSHCPKCGAAIRWWQNIPIFSWLTLRGRCASCKASISPRYIFVEAIGGLLFLAAFWRFGAYAPFMWVWLSLMIAGSFIDFDHQLLPDFVTVGGMVYGVALSLVSWLVSIHMPVPAMPLYPAFQPFEVPVLNSLAGLALGFSLLWLVRYFGTKAFKREAMGMGDVFLMGAVGALFGPLAVLVSLVWSSVLGSLVGIGMIIAAKARIGRFVAIPYGPYICLGCIEWMFFGPEIVIWYAGLVK